MEKKNAHNIVILVIVVILLVFSIVAFFSIKSHDRNVIKKSCCRECVYSASELVNGSALIQNTSNTLCGTPDAEKISLSENCTRYFSSDPTFVRECEKVIE